MNLKQEALQIARYAIQDSLPDTATKRALEELGRSTGRTIIVAVGKAGWQMAAAAAEVFRKQFGREAGVHTRHVCEEGSECSLYEGYVITKYGYSQGEIEGFTIFEAAHPVLDQNGIDATEVVLQAVKHLSAQDRVLLLLSGGGSALFEKPLVSLQELTEVTEQLLACGADIVEINTIRKRLSAVKGGRFAQLCAPAQVYSVILSDVVGDRPDMIASGPAYPDCSNTEEAKTILQKYGITLSEQAMKCIETETPDTLANVHTMVTGGVGRLCQAAKEECERRGFTAHILTDRMVCEAREAGSFLGSIAASHAQRSTKLAFIAGGETVVHLTGTGLGGRNQEIALAAAEQIAGLEQVVVLSIGSDGTDGPTDAAGGVVDGQTKGQLQKQGLKIYDVLKNNDAYHALQHCDGLIRTGATGTNVNDLSLILVENEPELL